jgi:hypothetical protein
MTDQAAGGGTAVVPFLDNPHAPEAFVEGAWGFLFLNGNVHITLTALRVDHKSLPGPVNRVVVGRLVMPLAGAQGFAVGLFNFLKQHGVDPASLSEQLKH